MNVETTHVVKISISGIYSQGPEKYFEINSKGDGQLNHLLASFQAVLTGLDIPVTLMCK